MDPQPPAPPLPAWVETALQLHYIADDDSSSSSSSDSSDSNDSWVRFEIPMGALIRLEYIEYWSQRLNATISSNDVGTGFNAFAFFACNPVGNVPITEIAFESSSAKNLFATLLQKIPVEGDQFDKFHFSSDHFDPGVRSLFPDIWETLGHLKTRKFKLDDFPITGKGQSSALCSFLQAQDSPNQEEEGQTFWGLQKLTLFNTFVDSEFQHHLGRALENMTHLEEIQTYLILSEDEQGLRALQTDFTVPTLLASAGSLRKIDIDPVGDPEILMSLGRDFPALEDLTIGFDDESHLQPKAESIQKAFQSNTHLLVLDLWNNTLGEPLFTSFCCNLMARNKRLKQIKESESTLPYEAWSRCIHRLGQPDSTQVRREILHHPHAGKSALFHFLRETFIPGHPKLLQPEQTYKQTNSVAPNKRCKRTWKEFAAS